MHFQHHVIYIVSCSVRPGGGNSKTGEVRVQRVKSHIFVPFGANLAQFQATSDSPVYSSDKRWRSCRTTGWTSVITTGRSRCPPVWRVYSYSSTSSSCAPRGTSCLHRSQSLSPCYLESLSVSSISMFLNNQTHHSHLFQCFLSFSTFSFYVFVTLDSPFLGCLYSLC